MKVDEIVELVGGELRGRVTEEITDIGSIQSAGPGMLTFLADVRYSRFLAETEASAVLVSKELAAEGVATPLIVVDDPHAALIEVLPLLRVRPPLAEPGISDTAQIHTSAEIADSVSIGPFVAVGADARIGPGSTLAHGVFVGAGVEIGEGCSIGPGTIVHSGTKIGDRVRIDAGSVIGSDGFGYVRRDDGTWEKVPQMGGVSIESDVEIGSCVSIDRGSIDDTTICTGAKLDNQIHIAHNVVIGAHTVIAAQTGISGSTVIGQKNMIAGQVGIVGHIETTDDVIIEAQSGVSKSLVKPGRYFGHPAKEHALALRQEGALRQLPDLLREIREMKRTIEELRTEVDAFEQELDQE